MHSIVTLAGGELIRPLSELLGDALVILWLGYGACLLVASTVGLNLAVLAVFTVLASRRSPPGRWSSRLTLPLEVVFCLINPLAYLLIFVRTSSDAEIFIDAQRSWWDFVAWVLLLSLWALRFAPIAVSERRRHWAYGLLSVGLVVLAMYFARDVLYAVERPSRLLRSFSDGDWSLWSVSLLLGIVGLYLIPAAVLLRYLRSARSRERWRLEKSFVILSGKGQRVLFGGLLAVVSSTLILLNLHPSDLRIEERLLSHRRAILEASSSTGTDPRVLASVLYAVQRRQGGVFGASLDRILGQASARDEGSHLMLDDALDPSLGLAQIKPLTAQTALQLVLLDQAGDRRLSWYRKQYRRVPVLGAAWEFPPGALDDLQPDPVWLPGKREVVRGLVRDETGVWMCAQILELYARQWEHADPAWAIRGRPQILATLYQLGFERSQPKADPRSNRFGEEVAMLVRSPWIEANFKPEGESCKPPAAAPWPRRLLR